MKTEKLKELGSDVGKFGAGAAGLVLGSLGMQTLPSLPGPPIVQKIAPGAIAMVIAFIAGSQISDKYGRAAAFGLGLAGFADALKKTVGASLPDKISKAIPTLSGIGLVQNYGQYPPYYFSQANAARLQGVGNAFALSGPSQGSGAKRLGSAYALSGPSQGSSAYGLN